MTYVACAAHFPRCTDVDVYDATPRQHGDIEFLSRVSGSGDCDEILPHAWGEECSTPAAARESALAALGPRP